MSYAPITFVNNGPPLVSARNLRHIETQYDKGLLDAVEPIRVATDEEMVAEKAPSGPAGAEGRLFFMTHSAVLQLFGHDGTSWRKLTK